MAFVAGRGTAFVGGRGTAFDGGAETGFVGGFVTAFVGVGNGPARIGNCRARGCGCGKTGSGGSGTNTGGGTTMTSSTGNVGGSRGTGAGEVPGTPGLGVGNGGGMPGTRVGTSGGRGGGIPGVWFCRLTGGCSAASAPMTASKATIKILVFIKCVRALPMPRRISIPRLARAVIAHQDVGSFSSISDIGTSSLHKAKYLLTTGRNANGASKLKA